MSETPPEGQDQIKINPNWNKMLEAIPESLHPMVLPHLQQWDQGVNQRFEELNNQYGPYKDLAKQGFDPDDIETALQLQQAINNDPAQFIQNAVEYFQSNAPGFNLSLADQQQLNNDNPSFADLNDEEIDVDALRKDPRFKPLFDQVDQQQQFITEWQQSQEDDDAAEELDEYLSELHESLGDFDDDYVIALIAADVDGEEAVQKYQKMIADGIAALNGGDQNTQQQLLANIQGQQQNNQQQPPHVMGQGGSVGSGLPHGGVNLSKLSKKDTNSLVTQMLEAAAQQNNPNSSG